MKVGMIGNLLTTQPPKHKLHFTCQVEPFFPVKSEGHHEAAFRQGSVTWL